MAKSQKLPMTLPEYERAFRVIHGILLTEQAEIPRSCLFFSVAGAAILKEHHNLPAQVVVGSALYKLGHAGKDGIGFGISDGGGLHPGPDNFHAWVQVGNWHLDFIAPLFREMFELLGVTGTLPRKMFQKPIVTQGCLEREGDFISHIDEGLTWELLRDFFKLAAHGDLVHICANWYQRPPKKIIPTLGVADQHGQVKPVPLSPLQLSGAW